MTTTVANGDESAPAADHGSAAGLAARSRDDAPALEVLGVSKSFAGVQALDDVTFRARAGSVHALVGENGAGKSTLIKVFTGVHAPDSGQVRLLGAPVSFAAPLEAQRAGISTIYQEVNLVPLMSVGQNLYLGREPKRFGLVDRRRMYADARRLLAEHGVDIDPTRPLRTLGLGLQQIVAVVRAVSVDASVVVMDEPTSSLEPREVDQLLDLVASLRDRGVAVVYVSHKMDEIFRICDEVTVLRDGRVAHTGPVAGLTRGRLVEHMLGRQAEELQRLREKAADQAADADPILEVLDLSRRAQLAGVSFEARPGEVVGLGGLLGSGRTETLRAVFGDLAVDGGSVTVAGRPMGRHTTGASVRTGIALLPEDRKAEGIVPGLSIRDNIALAALPRLSRLGLVSERRIDSVVRTFMDRLKIKASGPDQRVGDLSGGNQQKVVLARWLCTEPRVLLLDEPTRGIDVGAKTEVQALVADLAQQGLAIVLVSSEMEELVGGSSRIVVLQSGRSTEELVGERVAEGSLMDALASDRPDVRPDQDGDPA
ncbi:monosaccharide ABC transporter ATP-binding protein (CUT2 family) [Nocardioides albertanoniae]|uniref:Monosaccharide ABC transporter ATP-binding protein (CUT2 family) n=1 Tax=Nocardioides albertanoniae TaxID=1175486 RepID=A0A543A8T8_9ACTN|nr:sugar ABC transporter ATP-binding protein [Nocardioides albertanoniae]TQL68995.1 monosaccharide ABC transporter ATP-binding protein (CUT2 family) [Nocardioides albertanoniae]